MVGIFSTADRSWQVLCLAQKQNYHLPPSHADEKEDSEKDWENWQEANNDGRDRKTPDEKGIGK